MLLLSILLCFFFFTDPPTTEIYTLSLHDALPIYCVRFANRGRLSSRESLRVRGWLFPRQIRFIDIGGPDRSEEHTSELQSRLHLVCRLLLEKKKKKKKNII